MPNITVDQADKFKELVLSYLQGEDIISVTDYLRKTSSKIRFGCKSIYQSIKLEDKNDKFVTAILGSLNIKKSEEGVTGQYEELLDNANNLHELLVHLCHQGHYHLRYLVELIDATKPKRNWTLPLLFSTIASAGLGVFFYLNNEYFATIGRWFANTFPTMISWLGKTFSILKNIPLLGIIYKSFGLIWNWYEAFTTSTTTRKEKLNGLIFKTSSALLSIGAYVLSFLAGGVIGITGATLFVLSSAADVAHSLFNWYKRKDAWNSMDTPLSTADWEIWAEYYRAESLYKQDRKSVWINVIAAALTTAAVGIWCFFPPTLLMTVCCVSFMALTSLTARTILYNIKENAAYKLQETLATEMNVIPKENLLPTNRKLIIELHRQQERNAKKENELVAWEQTLFQKEGIIEGKVLNLNRREEQLSQRETAFQEFFDSTTQTLHLLKQRAGPLKASPQPYRGTELEGRIDKQPMVPPLPEPEASASNDSTLNDDEEQEQSPRKLI